MWWAKNLALLETDHLALRSSIFYEHQIFHCQVELLIYIYVLNKYNNEKYDDP